MATFSFSHHSCYSHMCEVVKYLHCVPGLREVGSALALILDQVAQ